jgi:hypothetical protein
MADIVLLDEASIFLDALRYRLAGSHPLHHVIDVPSLSSLIDRLEADGRDVLALLDLNLGLGQRSGLSALPVLLDRPRVSAVVFAADLLGDRALFALAAAEMAGGVCVVEKGQGNYADQVVRLAERLDEGYRPTREAVTRANGLWLDPLQFAGCSTGPRQKSLLEWLFRSRWRLLFYEAALNGSSQGQALRHVHMGADSSPAGEIGEVLLAVRRLNKPWIRLGRRVDVAEVMSRADLEHVESPLPWPLLNQFLAEHRAFFRTAGLQELLDWHWDRR